MEILWDIRIHTERPKRSKTSSAEYNVTDVMNWEQKRKRVWNDHIERINTKRIAKIARGRRLETRSPKGRPLKRCVQLYISTSDDTKIGIKHISNAIRRKRKNRK